MNKTERYDGIDGLRTYAMLGIVIIYVLDNGEYVLQNTLLGKVVLAFELNPKCWTV